MQTETTLRRDADGYLFEPEQWNEEVAELLAAETGLELSSEHWRIMRFMRAFAEQRGITPDVRHVVEFLVDGGGFDKKSAKEHLFKLFPYGYMQQACKVAGMPRPRAWSTG